MMKKTIVITTLMFLVSFANADDPSLRAWYKFEDGSGTVVSDSSGNGFDGTLNGTMYWNHSGAIGNCLSNNRAWSGAYVDIPAGVFATADQQLTVAFWANRTDMCETYGTGSFIKGSASGSNKLGVGDYKSDTGAHYTTYAGGDGTTKWWWSYGANVGGNEWHHLAVVFDFAAGTEKLYFNGLAVSTQGCDASDSFAGIDACRIFTRKSSGANEWYDSYHGEMDDFRIYDRALDDGEIWLLANPADINGDKMVDMEDLQRVAYEWLDDSYGEGDIDKDGIVNFKDYAFLVDKWNAGGKYYFDSLHGNDNNLGTSSDEAWQSLSKFNSTTFVPGDKIYFKTDSVWNGQLKPKGSGVSGRPIIIDAYGTIYDQDAKPCFNGNGTVGAALYVRNVEYWEINNLQITNQGATRGAWRKGASISADNFGTMHHIHLKNLYVHNVNGLLAKEDGGGAGISWFCSGDTVPTKFDGILIEGCYVKTTDRDGIVGGNTKIGMNSTDPRDPADWYPSVNVVVRGNLLEDIGGDGIVPIGTDGCIVEYNIIDGGSQRTYNYEDPSQFAVGIWPWSSDNTIVQYNEVSGMKGTRDGQGYDCDYNCQNSLFQYNYSHDNEGGFMLVCDNDDGVGQVNPIIRYNISQNDQERIFHLGAGASIYNNVIYNGAGSDVSLVRNFAGCTGKSYFKNNIFLSLGTYRFDYNAMKSSNNSFSNNCWRANSWKKEILWYLSGIYSNGRPSGSNEITSDPQFVSSGSGGDGIDSLGGYKLQSSSPCIGAGLVIIGNGGYDFWDNLLYNGGPDVGAYEKP